MNPTVLESLNSTRTQYSEEKLSAAFEKFHGFSVAALFCGFLRFKSLDIKQTKLSASVLKIVVICIVYSSLQNEGFLAALHTVKMRSDLGLCCLSLQVSVPCAMQGVLQLM